MTHREEHPLQHLAVFVRARLRVERELELRVVVLLEVEEDRGGLEHGKVGAVRIDDDGDAPVRVQLDEPGLLLRPLRDVDRVYAARIARVSARVPV